MVTGLSVARLLNGWARFVQHPSRNEIYVVHLGWSVFLFLSVIHFWWFEFGFSQISSWHFPIYFFIIFYAALLFFLCALIFPDDLHGYENYEAYFYSRQSWFFGLLALMFAIDLIDTELKGARYFHSLGALYPFRQVGLCILSLIAMRTERRSFHAGFLIVALLAESWWAVYQFESLF
ncbi:hypothetical protein [Amorphus sp. 3PC139-8]|uniref:hypothetical protein n=1 Tax=Amorphus sp. 3PC139-8 TaxID=2735676 RepID=UPI00345DF8C1